ncbi:uncharacterized protein LOC103788723 isoform X3 [Callithrix jacchus]|uniref:uncharacterized protein LOC103788723 isoform X3 n=1 Tax=Callithrix jacchus TaxID=9483 RepID=UPI0004F021C1|nr:uncharacterized protein LOC103788723 isoform X3 [Callithrix jacchus]
MSESSSSQNTSGQELCPSNSSCYSDPSETHIGSAPSSRGIFHLRLDSGISSLLPSDSCKYLSRHKVEQYGIQGSQLRCPTVREGPSEEEHLFRQLECNLPPRKRVLEKNGKHGYKKTGKTVRTSQNLLENPVLPPYTLGTLPNPVCCSVMLIKIFPLPVLRIATT